MFKIFLFIFLFSQICKSLQYENLTILTFNDNFTYMNCSNCNNETKKALYIYLGNELIYLYLNINSPNETKEENITFDENKIVFSFKYEENQKSLIYFYNNTKVYFLGDSLFLFGEKLSNGTIINNINISLADKTCLNLKNGTNDISFGSVTHIMLSGDGEYLFIKFPRFSFMLVISGFLISLYGSYYYRLSLMIHMFFLLNFVICDIINFFSEVQLHIYFISFAFFLVSLSASIFLKNSEKNNFKKFAINGIYGATLGFTFFKTIFYYIFYFLDPIDSNTLPEDLRFPIYLVVLIITCAIFVILNLCEIFGTYAYVPCSIIAGSFYVIKGLQYILGGYYSSILFFKKSLEFKITPSEKKEIILTYSILHLVILIFSSFFQIRYLRLKKIELESNFEEINRTSRLSLRNNEGRESQNSSNNQSLIKESDESLLNSKIKDENDNSLNEENEIDDQDD